MLPTCYSQGEVNAASEGDLGQGKQEWNLEQKLLYCK